MGKQNRRGQSVQQFSPKSPKHFRNLWMLIVYTNNYPVKKFIFTHSTIKFDIGGEGTAPECSW